MRIRSGVGQRLCRWQAGKRRRLEDGSEAGRNEKCWRKGQTAARRQIAVIRSATLHPCRSRYEKTAARIEGREKRAGDRRRSRAVRSRSSTTEIAPTTRGAPNSSNERGSTSCSTIASWLGTRLIGRDRTGPGRAAPFRVARDGSPAWRSREAVPRRYRRQRGRQMPRDRRSRRRSSRRAWCSGFRPRRLQSR